jgi:hypothetical protein
MAATRQQGTYLGTTLIGFTTLVGGLYGGGTLGIVVTVVGAAFLLYSGFGFYRAKAAA